MILLLATLCAHAADLRLQLDFSGQAEWAGASPSLDVTFHDVQPGALPSLSLPGPPGLERRLDVTVTPDAAGRVQFDAKFYEVAQRPHGRRTEKLVSAPRVIAQVGEEAQFTQGARYPVAAADGSIAFVTNEVSLKLLYVLDG